VTNKTNSQSNVVAGITTMIEHCESYLALPQKDEALKQARIRHDNAISQATYKANQERNQISSVISSIQTFETTLTNALSDRGSKLPEATPVETMVYVSMAELESRRSKSLQIRDSMMEYLRDIDEILQFYGTVRTVGYILLGLIFLIAVLVLTGVINLN